MIEPDYLAGGEGTTRTALWLWSSRNPPITYNVFQSLYFELVRDSEHSYVDNEVPPDGETMSKKQSRMKAMYTEI